MLLGNEIEKEVVLTTGKNKKQQKKKMRKLRRYNRDSCNSGFVTVTVEIYNGKLKLKTEGEILCGNIQKVCHEKTCAFAHVELIDNPDKENLSQKKIEVFMCRDHIVGELIDEN
jgi:hypothetical protein